MKLSHVIKTTGCGKKWLKLKQFKKPFIFCIHDLRVNRQNKNLRAVSKQDAFLTF